jgi:hypothetical protein
VYRRAMLRVLLMTYQIETYTLCGGWVNIWTDSLDDTLVTFDTYAAAQAELADFLGELAYAVKVGHLDDYNPEDYRIVEVPI